VVQLVASMIVTPPWMPASNAAAVSSAAVVFLASDDALNIHGSTLSVDGGFSVI
jgi:NAD(P)-dependent dehydrogenase (short-subunit alcohol dehydrogenase family)